MSLTIPMSPMTWKLWNIFQADVTNVWMMHQSEVQWMPLDLTDNILKLVQVIPWCHRTTNYSLSQFWPWSMLLYGVMEPQWVKSRLKPNNVPAQSIAVTNIKHDWYFCLTIDDSYECFGEKVTLLWRQLSVQTINVMSGNNFASGPIHF